MSHLTVPSAIRQREVIELLAKDVVARVDVAWDELTLNVRNLAPYGQFETMVTLPSGEVVQKFAPRSTSKWADELRELMYRPGSGTWYSARLTISSKGSVDMTFNYDDEPDWSRPVEPVFYVQDLERYPRTDDAIPAWLKKQLALAREKDGD